MPLAGLACKAIIQPGSKNIPTLRKFCDRVEGTMYECEAGKAEIIVTKGEDQIFLNQNPDGKIANGKTLKIIEWKKIGMIAEIDQETIIEVLDL